MSSHETGVAQRAFHEISESRAAVLQDEIESHLAAMYMLRDFYDASHSVEREEFRAFVSGLIQQFPSLTGVAQSVRVEHRDRAGHETALRQKGLPDYEIREKTDDRRLVRAGDRPVYHPFIFSHTDDQELYRRFVGFDPQSDPVRHDAMRQAEATGSIALTAPLELIYKAQRRWGIVAVLPLHKLSETPDGPPRGFLFGGFRLDSVLANAMDHHRSVFLSMSLADITEPGRPVSIWPDPEATPVAADLPWVSQTEVQWGGRRVRIEHRPMPGFLASYQSIRPIAGLAAGLLVTAALLGYLGTMQLRAAKVERLVDQRTAELSAANAELDGKNRRLAVLTETAHRFVDNVAHEFRTPLTVIKEFNAIVDEELGGPVTPEQHEYLGYVNAAADELSQMVDDFLDSSKLKANTLRIDRRPHHPQALLDQTRTVLSLRAKTRSIELIEDIEPGLPEVFCDLDKAARVLINLTINAIKFSDVGQPVTLRVARDEHDDIRVSVIDHGPGLSSEELELVSQRFQQVGDPARTSSKGFGLGLNIAKELVWLNLGHMDIQSTPGSGSTFSFTLPRWEPGRIVAAYLDALAMAEPNDLAQTPDTSRLLLLEARSPESHAIPGDQLMARLSGITRATDLLMVTPDGGVLLLGTAPGDGSWADRLREEHRQRLRLQDTDAWRLELTPSEEHDLAADPQTLIQTVRRRMSADASGVHPSNGTEEYHHAA
ncbi:MAG: CHASE domain-containing protein [Planctomycetota bacterium]